MALVRASTVVLRSALSSELSPLVTAGNEDAVTDGGWDVAAGGGEVEREGEDRRDHDTWL